MLFSVTILALAACTYAAPVTPTRSLEVIPDDLTLGDLTNNVPILDHTGLNRRQEESSSSDNTLLGALTSDVPVLDHTGLNKRTTDDDETSIIPLSDVTEALPYIPLIDTSTEPYADAQ